MSIKVSVLIWTMFLEAILTWYPELMNDPAEHNRNWYDGTALGSLNILLQLPFPQVSSKPDS
jgi:hypothetical protein